MPDFTTARPQPGIYRDPAGDTLVAVLNGNGRAPAWSVDEEALIQRIVTLTHVGDGMHCAGPLLTEAEVALKQMQRIAAGLKTGTMTMKDIPVRPTLKPAVPTRFLESPASRKASLPMGRPG